MTVYEFVQNVMENDREGIERMTIEQAADILNWMRGDDENGTIPEDLTSSQFAEIWNEIKGIGPCTISIDNGHSTCTPEEAIAQTPWELIVDRMDDATREAVHNELAPCINAEFLQRYLELAPCDLIIG